MGWDEILENRGPIINNKSLALTAKKHKLLLIKYRILVKKLNLPDKEVLNKKTSGRMMDQFLKVLIVLS